MVSIIERGNVMPDSPQPWRLCGYQSTVLQALLGKSFKEKV
jgi:hypothetical protein